MVNTSRTKNSIRNLLFSFFAFALQLICTLFIRICFVKVFLVDYLGINSLFTNIISILSVVESGFGSAMTFALYEPVAKGEDEKVRQLLAFYKKCYRVISLCILIIGLAIMPCLPYLIKDFAAINLNLYIVYAMFLASSFISYFSAHRRALFYASQRVDIENKINIAGYVVTLFIQILALFVFKNYYVYSLAGLINSIISCVLVYIMTNIKFANYIKREDEGISKQDRKNITKNVMALFFHKVGGIVLSGTDSIIISAFLGSVILGKYSNYLMITTYINTLLMTFINSVKGSVGNSLNLKDKDSNFTLFKRLNFIYFAISALFSIAFVVLSSPFVDVMFGEELVLSFDLVLIMGIYLYLYNTRQIVYMFKDCKGYFWQNRFAPIIEAVINLIVSLILVQVIGLLGVILGTIISCILVPLWNEPYILNKHYFKRSTLKYFGKYLLCALATVVSAVVTISVCNFIVVTNFWTLILKGIVCVVVAGLMLLITMAPFKEFKECVKWGKEIVVSFRNKRFAQRAKITTNELIAEDNIECQDKEE